MEKMASYQWATAPSIIQTLFSKPYKVSFLQAVSLLQKWIPGGKSLGDNYHAIDDPFIFVPRHSYSLPTSDLYSLSWDKQNRPVICVNFPGIESPHGPLPTPLSELIHDQLYDKNTSLKDFLDIFNNRLISLYCLVAQKYSFVLSPKLFSETPAGIALDSFSGIENKQLGKKLSKYAGLLWQRPRSASALEHLLSSFFKIETEIEQFVGEWIPISEEQQTKLGKRNYILGISTFLGKKFWSYTHHFIVHLKNVDLENFYAFLPTGERFQEIRDIICLYTTPEQSFQIKLSLDKNLSLPDNSLNPSSCLGWNTHFSNENGYRVLLET